MANLPEKEEWEEVYQWETSDRALGGPGGVMNKPLLNLVNRTAFLKKSLEGKASTTPANLNDAGIVKLSNAIDSSSESTAATSKAVKAIAELAAGKLSSIPIATNDEVFKGLDTEKAVVSSALQSKGFFYSAVELKAESTITSADFGKRLRLDSSSPSSLTLPDSRALKGSGQTISIWNNKAASVQVSVFYPATEFISLGLQSPTNIVLNPGETVTFIVARAGGWHASGDGILKYSQMFSFSHALNGYSMSPNGTIHQWGSVVVNSAGDAIINFPIPFPVACFSINALSGANANAVYAPTSLTNATAVLPFFKTDNGIKSLGGFNCMWYAIGK